MFGKSHKYEPRITGRTTRLVDQYIQEFFLTGDISPKDHWDNGNSKNANKELFNRILRRLEIEHNALRHSGTLKRDIHNLRIWFVPKSKDPDLIINN